MKIKKTIMIVLSIIFFILIFIIVNINFKLNEVQKTYKIDKIVFFDRYDYSNFENNYQGKLIRYWGSNGMEIACYSSEQIIFKPEEIALLPVEYKKERIPEYAHSFFPLNEIKYIVVHNTANPYADAEDHYTYISTNSEANTSAHFYVDDTQIIQALPTNLACWSVGTNDNLEYQGIKNSNSINIEICETGDIDKAINNAMILIRDLLLPHMENALVVRHYDATLKLCPRYINDNKWTKFLNDCYNYNIPENYYEELSKTKILKNNL